MCVQPWTKGLPPPLFLPYMGRGTQHFTGTVSNEATSEMGYPAWPAGRTCSFFHKLFRQSSAFCFMVLHVFHPTNRFFQQPFTDLRRAARATDRLCRLEQQFLKHLQVFGPFTLRFFAILPIGEIELTEYKLSKCVNPCFSKGSCSQTFHTISFSFHSICTIIYIFSFYCTARGASAWHWRSGRSCTCLVSQ